MQDVYIVSAVRTPMGRFGGGLAEQSPAALGAVAMGGALEAAGLPGAAIDLYVFGHVLRAGHGQLVPRQAAMRAGIPATVNGYAIDMVCASGMMSVLNGATAIAAGTANLVLAGGMESMSQSGIMLSHRARWGYKLMMPTAEPLIDLLVCDGLSDPTTAEKMGEQAERLAASYGITRSELDAVALHSHERATEAMQSGWLSQEIVPIAVASKKGTNLFEKDEGLRPDTTIEKLAALKPAFQPDGVLTAGNSSQISDGAAALLLASPAAVNTHGLKPIARLLRGTWAGGEAWRFPEIPVQAVEQLLAQLRLTIADVDLFENNEAFALSSILFHRLLGVPYSKLNVFGGAIALGHPIGASGARILVTLLNALQTQDRHLGVAAICHGSGGGTAVAIERLQ